MGTPTKLKATPAEVQLVDLQGASGQHPSGDALPAHRQALARSCNSGARTYATQGPEHALCKEDIVSLKAYAVEAIRAYVSATINDLITLSDDANSSRSVKLRIGHIRRQGLAVSEQLDDFIGATEGLYSLFAFHPNGFPRAATHRAPTPKAQDNSQGVSADLHKMTARERNVLALLARGLPNKQIAYELGISTTTTKAHMGSILRKLNVSSRGRAIALLANIDLAAEALVTPEM